MRFREVERNSEKEKLNKKKEEGFKKIKPETNITVDEAKNFIDNLFASMRESSQALSSFFFFAKITYSFMKKIMI